MSEIIYTWPPEINSSTVWTDWKGDFVTQDTIDNSLSASDTFTAILKKLEEISVDSRCQNAYNEALRELERYFEERVSTLNLTDDDILLDCGCDIYLIYNTSNHTSWITLQNAGFNSYAISSRTNISNSLLAYSGTASKDNSHGVFGWNISQNISNIKTVSALNVSKNDGGTGVWTDFTLPFHGSYSNSSSSFYRVSSGFSYNLTHTAGSTSVEEHIYFRASSLALSSRDATNPNGTDTSTSGKYPSGSMGGQGTFDDSTDLSDISTKPSLNLANLGFFSVWNPSASELRSLADYVWNDPANIAQWPQIFRDGIMHPSDYIISLALYPFASSVFTKSNETFCMGGIPFNGGVTALGMTINMDKITEQFIDINMGTVDLKEYFGSFLDYAPYSQISLYLPYYGTVQLSMNEVQNADSISVLYRVNILDGSTSIKVHIDRQTSAAQNGSVPLKHVLYEYFTNLKTEIPRTSGASTEQMKMLATVLSATVTAAAPIAGAGVSHLAGGVQGAMAGGGMAGFMAGAQQGMAGVGQAVESGLKMGASAGNKLVNSMPSGGSITRGNIGGMNNGLLSERRPFLIITRPIQVLPANYQDMEGYTTSVFTTLGALESGFVQCESVDTSGLDATATEKEEIVKLLQGGVFI